MASSAKNLKIKIIVKKSTPCTSEIAKSSLTRDGENRGKKTELVDVNRCVARGSEDRKPVTSIYGTKRAAEDMIDHRSWKRLKMDRIVVRKCLLILKKLMTHPYGPGFNQPVDPDALNIPDYFTIISKPMDLGTIKSKLEKDIYATADEFEADIRLTFSNAMQYNPPCNPFHKMAKELNSLFSAQWRFLGSIVERESRKCKTDNGLGDGDRKLLDMRSGCPRMCSPNIEATGKMNVKGLLKQEPARNVPAKKVRTNEEEKNQVSKMASKLHGSSAVPLGNKSSVKVSDVLRRRSFESTKKMEPMKKKEPTIGKKVPLRSPRTSGLKPPSSDLKTSEKIVDQVAVNRKPSKNCDSHPTSRGGLSWLDEEPAFVNHHATFASTAFDSDGWRSPICETQLSPAKALRAEMLKRRFADTILKAQKQTLLCPGEKCDQVKMEVEKQRLGRQHAEEKQKPKGEVKASLDGHGSDRRIQHQREREAARIALEKMENSVEFEDNIAILRDLANMIGDFSFAGPLRGYGGMYVSAKQFVNGKLMSPLERLGLYLKEDDDYMFGDDDQGHDRETLPEDYEEGELIY